MKIRTLIANFIDPTHKNSVGDGLARDYFKYGPQTATLPDWSQLMMSDQDKYTGYMYGAITRRANKVVSLATDNLHTSANEATTTAAKNAKKTIQHPYLSIIDESTEFTNEDFWYQNQTFVDLKGEAYVMAIRGKVGKKVGPIKEFKLLRPTELITVWDVDELEVIGYTETRGGMFREIPVHMVIPMRAFNPFSRRLPYAMADAAKDAQFTLKEVHEQIRTTARRNRKYPGVVLMGGGEVGLDPEQVSNFKARMRGKSTQDEPMFAAGTASTMQWNDMQVDLRKSLPEVANEINLNALTAVTGTSKTKFSIEQSGVTRDTADIQDDLFVADHAIPALRIIVGSLNQDYKKHYPNEYKDTGYKLYIKSPLDDDKESELKTVEIRQKSFDLYTSLVAKGFPPETAAQYANGDKELDEIGAPATPKPEASNVTAASDKDDTATPNAHEHKTPASSSEPRHPEAPAVIHNQLDQAGQSTLSQQEAGLKNVVINVERHLVSAVLNKLTQNAFDSQSDIISSQDRDDAQQELKVSLEAFYAITIPLNGASVMARRSAEFGKPGSFTADRTVNDYIKLTATNAASSHVNTVLDDILKTVRETVERLVQGELAKVDPKPGQTAEEILAFARKKALEGVGQEQIVAAIRQEYNQTISKVRAETIARTESRRAFNRAQYEADRQFLAQNELTGRAYKKWVTRSDDPCPFCIEKSKEAPIPFDTTFAQVGDVLKAPLEKQDGTSGVRQMKVGFEDVEAGNLHPNCQCTYQLIIE